MPEEKTEQLRQLCTSWDVDLSDIGSFTDTGRLVVRHGGTGVIDLPMALLHDGLPRRSLEAEYRDPAAPSDPPGPSALSAEVDLPALILDLLAHPNVASRESIVRCYDHEVRGGTVVRPFTGPDADGPTDAAVIKPLGTWHHRKAVALAVGINPRLTHLDPRAMALHVIDEAFRNLVAVGADPDRVALLDNFCWGDPTLPDRLGSMVLAVQGCVEGSLRYRAPFISGKDSLNNEFDGRAVPGTLLISAVGVVPDLRRVVTSALTRPGNDLWLVGRGSHRLGGSIVADLPSIGDAHVPHTTRVPHTINDPLPRYRAVHKLIAAGRISAAHDVSDGGIAVALAEMAIGGQLGLSVTIPNDSSADGPAPADDAGDPSATGANDSAWPTIAALANEAPGQILLEAPASERATVAAGLGRSGRRIGTVTGTDEIEMRVADHSTTSSTDHSTASATIAITIAAARRAFLSGR